MSASSSSSSSREQVTLWGANIGMLCLLIAGAMPLFSLGPVAAWKWLYAIGAAIVLICRIVQPTEMPTLRARRLRRMEFWSAVVWAVGVFFIFYKGAGPTDWLAFFLAGGVLQAYASLAMPSALKAKDAASEGSRKRKG